jgi:ComF family protein
VVRAVVDDLVTTIFPSDCRVCGEPLLRADLSPVCDECIDRVQEQSMTLCVRCGEALDMEGVRFAGQFPVEGLLCSPCRMAPPEFERAVAHALYRDEMREMVHLLKYERMREVARPLGKMLARTIETLEAEAGKELLVVAVPLFRSKEWERGYNQAVLISDAALVELKKSRPGWRLQAAHGVIRRVKDTRSQFELTPKGRRRNLQGAFAIADGSILAGREVLLIDDIYTTGATARACSRVLRQAGASKVWVATVSRAQPEMVALWSAPSNTAVWDAG